MGTNDQLPDGWIRKESTSRPNRFYYFNKRTGQTQWDPPKKKIDKIQKEVPRDAVTAKPSKCDTGFKGRSTVQNPFKINDKSKDVKKAKLKTPAQNRLQNFIATNKAFDESVKRMLDSKSTDLVSNKREKPTIQRVVVAKKLHTVIGRTGDDVDSAKLVQPHNNKDLFEATTQQSTIESVKSSLDEIPALFPSKTLAQERLKSLQNKLGNNVNKEEHDSVRVFHTSFGINDSVQTTTSIDMDEEMDWEPCDDSTYSFQQLESMAVDDHNTSEYIVPDTNVWLDSLASVKSILEKDLKYSILIPFVVLQELDQLKRRSEENLVSMKSSRAIRFIYDQLKQKNPRLKGQRASEDSRHIIDVTSPDDKILNCCLQLKELKKGEVISMKKEVILVTNDKNLSNKAKFSDVEAITSQECLQKF